MGSTNLGNQIVYDSYGQALTSAVQGSAKQDILQPGIIKGCDVSKYSDTQIRIAPGVFSVSDGAKTVKVSMSSLVTLDCTSTYSYVVARYSYVASSANYVDFYNVATLTENDLLLAELSWDSGAIDIVTLTNKSNAKSALAEDVMIDTGSENRSLQALYETNSLITGETSAVYTGYVTNFWIDPETMAEEVLINDLLTGMAFPNDASKYFYFLLKTGAQQDIIFKLRLCGSIATSGGVKLNLKYYHLANGADLSSIKTTITNASFTTETITMPGTAYTMVEHTTTTLKIPLAANSTPDRLILCRLERDYSDPGDTYTGKLINLGIIPA